jgi:hypothetical protein
VEYLTQIGVLSQNSYKEFWDKYSLIDTMSSPALKMENIPTKIGE